ADRQSATLYPQAVPSDTRSPDMSCLSAPISTVGFGNNGLAKANLHGANDQKVLAGGDRESVGAGFTDSGNR
ncbi:hypothetical protein, partial [Vreelandella aquamarina]|uniref:hypothetical protein n=1 Tax=Vreelandella aquamarina TaxID=77097 RepID=UPI0023586466